MESTTELTAGFWSGLATGILIGTVVSLLIVVIAKLLSKAKSRRGIAWSAILFGWLGVHRFKLGNKKQGFINLAITIASIIPFVPGGIVMFFIGVFEGVKYLRMSDEDFERIYRSGERKWF
jgi:predicted membrane channel-forming protein YqfA (hemolysin III family)